MTEEHFDKPDPPIYYSRDTGRDYEDGFNDGNRTQGMQFRILLVPWLFGVLCVFVLLVVAFMKS